MKRSSTLLLSIVVLIAGCGASSPRLSPGGHSDPVSMTRGTRALVAPSRQFVSYVASAARLSVIDQGTEAESYGFDFPATVRAAFPVARFDGVGALTDQGLSIFSAGALRSFPFENASSDWDAARDAAAFAFSQAGGVRVIRHLDQESWQDELLAGLQPAAVDAPVMSTDGTLLVLLRPGDGSYAIFRAPDASAAMRLDHVCAAEAMRSSPIVALALFGTRLFWGDAGGQLGVLDTAEPACQPVTASASLPDDTDVARLLPRSDRSILAFGVGGRVYEWNGSEELSAHATLEGCEFPLSPLALEGDALLALCLSELGASSDARTVVYESAAYKYFAAGQEQATYGLELNLAKVAALGVDERSRRLFVMADSALGRLKIVDLVTGRTHERQGLFVKNLLER